MEKTNSQFRHDELIIIRGQNYPKVGGRLRLAHESNDSLSLTTEIVQYDGKVAVIKSICNTAKGSFTGLGMASVDRDVKLASAILELAETRAIARSLRFAGYGVEFTGAEEMSHLEAQGHNGTSSSNMTFSQTNYTGNASTAGNNNFQPPPPATQPINNYPPANTVPNNSQPQQSQQQPNSDDGRLSGKQYKFILALMGNAKKSKEEMDQVCISSYGRTLQHLSKKDASQLIESLVAK
jgi:hypothetical protein